MDTASVLPHVNAALNATSTVLLLIGYAMIRSGRRDKHRAFMIAAIAVSALFLASYLTYHFTAPIFQFRGTGAIVPVYYTILITHVVLAALVTPAVLYIAYQALKERFDRHKKWARVVFPVWLYVTTTGVVIYLMLYHIYPEV